MIPEGFPLDRRRAQEILSALPTRRVAVLGDFHLDVYWHADMRRARLSRETPHFARPVVEERYDPGVGGVIAANLRALGVGTVLAVGACGDDWRGAVLRRRLEDMGVALDAFRAIPGRVTPTYAKPMIHGYESVQEDPRLDFEDRRDLSAEDEARLVADLRRLVPEVDGIAVIDQIEEETGGTVSPRVRDELAAIGDERPTLPVLADSRARIGAFRSVLVKVNRMELAAALEREMSPDRERVFRQAAELSARTGRPVLVSLGAGGMCYATTAERGEVPAVPVSGPIDPVGAGDAASAGIVSALACGASLAEAAAFGNLVASVTVRKIGVTGTASPSEILGEFEERPC